MSTTITSIAIITLITRMKMPQAPLLGFKSFGLGVFEVWGLGFRGLGFRALGLGFSGFGV